MSRTNRRAAAPAYDDISDYGTEDEYTASEGDDGASQTDEYSYDDSERTSSFTDDLDSNASSSFASETSYEERRGGSGRRHHERGRYMREAERNGHSRYRQSRERYAQPPPGYAAPPPNGRMPPGGVVPVATMGRFASAAGSSTGVSLATPQGRMAQMLQRQQQQQHPYAQNNGNGYGRGGWSPGPTRRQSDSITAQGLVERMRQGQALVGNNPFAAGANALMPPNPYHNPASRLPAAMVGLGDLPKVSPYTPTHEKFRFPTNFTILGSAGSGKTTVQYNLAATYAPRFDALFLMTPNEGTYSVFRKCIPFHWAHKRFEPSIVRNIITECDKIVGELGKIPCVGLWTDDIFTVQEGNAITKSPELLELDKRSRQIGVTKCESTHHYADKSSGARAAVPVVGIMCAANSQLVEQAYHHFFKGYGYKNVNQFSMHLKRLGGKGSCLFAAGDELIIYHARRIEQIAPFTIGHPEAYIILHHYSEIKDDGAKVPLDPMFAGGLKNSHAFRRAYSTAEERARMEALANEGEEIEQDCEYIEYDE